MVRRLIAAAFLVLLVCCSVLAQDAEIRLVGEQQPQDAKQKGLIERLKIPPQLPGADAPPIPKDVSSKDRKEREAAIDRLYPPLPQSAPLPEAAPGRDGKPLTLDDLQQLALSNSPLIRQAAADVQAARGAVIQAGLWPNPTVGYESDQVQPGSNAGQQGWFIEQVIKTASKPSLARAAAGMDYLNTQVALRKAESDLLTQVRSNYFAVLVARASFRANAALAQLTEEVYRIQVDQLKGGEAAAYEPMQLQVLALQARTALVQAHNRYISAWKQLAATLNMTEMPLTQLDGDVAMPIPRVGYELALNRILASHTDVLTAQNGELRARYNLQLARATRVPDITAHAVFQHDNSVGREQYGLQIGLPLPLWDRNQGNILQAEGQLARAQQELGRIRNDLTSRLADAFERYENNRVILDYYRTQILPAQVGAYRGAYQRHSGEPDKVTFGDVVNAQQTLAGTLSNYLSALDAQWKAVVDLAGLLQVDALAQLGEGEPIAPVPELAPCMPKEHHMKAGKFGYPHPAAPTPAPAADTLWLPAVLPAEKKPDGDPAK